MKKRILLVSHSLSRTGAPIVLQNIANELSNNENYEITVYNVNSANPDIVNDFNKKVKVIEYPIWISKLNTPLDKPVLLNNDIEYPLIFARDADEFQQILFWLFKEELLGRISKTEGFRLSLKGWQRVQELKKFQVDSNQAFVASWFDDSMDFIYQNGIKPALEEMDYKPVWMKVIEHNGKIDDRIIAEIRRSGLVISDFTGNRGGVYYEAGFAQGLGIPVIWMCKNDPEELKNLHFDTRQYNHILWENAGDLKEKLINRIGAKFPGRAQRTTGKKPD